MSHTYIYPDKTFSKVDFPAPDGPIIAVSSPVINVPDTPFRIFLPETKDHYYELKFTVT